MSISNVFGKTPYLAMPLTTAIGTGVGSQTINFDGGITTTTDGTTSVNIFSMTLARNRQYVMKLCIQGSDGTDIVAYYCDYLYTYYVSSNWSHVNAQGFDSHTGALSAAQIVISNSGDNFTVNVIGVARHNINWAAFIEYNYFNNTSSIPVDPEPIVAPNLIRESYVDNIKDSELARVNGNVDSWIACNRPTRTPSTFLITRD